MELKTKIEIIIVALSVCVSCIVLLFRVPTNIWRDKDALNIVFASGTTKEISLTGVSLCPIKSEDIRHIRAINAYVHGKKKAGLFENTETGNRFYLYSLGLGSLVSFESEGQKYIVDCYFEKGFNTAKTQLKSKD